MERDFKETLIWNSVESNSPQENRKYLVKYKFGVTESAFMNGNFVLSDNFTTTIPEVTHFSNLPKGVSNSLEEEFKEFKSSEKFHAITSGLEEMLIQLNSDNQEAIYIGKEDDNIFHVIKFSRIENDWSESVECVNITAEMVFNYLS